MKWNLMLLRMLFLRVELLVARGCYRMSFCHAECLDPWETAVGRPLVCRIVSVHGMSLVIEVFLGVLVVRISIG